MAKHLHQQQQVPSKKGFDQKDDTQGCYVPLSVGGPLTPVCRASELEGHTHGWIWNGRVRAGHLTAIVGPKGAGKSTLIAEIAARVSTGGPWPDDPQNRGNAAEVLIVTGEDEPEWNIVPRLRACGADFDNVHLCDFRHDDGTPGEITVEAIAEASYNMPGLKLIVIDPIADLLGEKNDRRLGEIRTLFRKLAKFASGMAVAIILVNATDKVSAGKVGQYGVDVLPFIHAGARAVWTVEEDPSEPGRSLWLPARNDLAAGRSGLAFRVERKTGRVVWDPEPVELKADELQPAHRLVSKIARAADWLREYLEDGARTAVEVRRDATLAGISRGALYEAKGRLGVLSVKETDTANGGWEWRLPEWCESEKQGESPQDSKIVAKIITTIRGACGLDAKAPGGEVAGAVPEAEKGFVGPVAGSETESDGNPSESPEDSKISKVREATVERGRDRVGIQRPSVGRVGGMPGLNAVALGRGYGEIHEDSKILEELVGVP